MLSQARTQAILQASPSLFTSSSLYSLHYVLTKVLITSVPGVIVKAEGYLWDSVIGVRCHQEVVQTALSEEEELPHLS